MSNGMTVIGDLADFPDRGGKADKLTFVQTSSRGLHLGVWDCSEITETVVEIRFNRTPVT